MLRAIRTSAGEIDRFEPQRRDVFLFDNVPVPSMRVPGLFTNLVLACVGFALAIAWSSIGAYDLLALLFGEAQP